MKLAIRHRVGCDYAPPVEDAAFALRVLPASDEWQTVDAWEVAASPSLAREESTDGFGNRMVVLAGGPVALLDVEAHGRVTTLVDNPFAFSADDARPSLRDEARSASDAGLAAYHSRRDDPWDASAEVALFARTIAGGDGVAAFEAVQRLSSAIHGFDFRAGVTTVDTAPDEVLRRRAGLCQDFATLLAASARALGLAARYVSGYVWDGPAATRRTGTTTHAWAEVRFSRIGWRGFDPTNGILAAGTHVRLAAGRWFHDVAPLSGRFARGGASQRPYESTEVEVLT